MAKVPFYVVGNWKSNKTMDEAAAWFQEFAARWQKSPFDTQKVRVILCPAYIHLAPLAQLIKQTQIPLELGLQDISPFPSGTYTGAVSAAMVKGLVTTVLVGHSERRQHFHETEAELIEKIRQAQAAGITPIYCVQNDQMEIPKACDIVGYEPPWAISKGDPYATQAQIPQKANKAAKLIKQRAGRSLTVIYGGSTQPDNIAGYVKQPDINGVLPGGASLSATTFYDLIVNASQT